MLTRLEALNYRCLKWVDQDLDPFQVLIGPNASGKSTFCDVIRFLARLVPDRLERVIDERTNNFEGLLWQRKGTMFELAIELKIPEDYRGESHKKGFDTVRYMVAVGIDEETKENSILHERVVSFQRKTRARQRSLFPAVLDSPDTLKKSPKRCFTLATKTSAGDRYYLERRNGFNPTFKLGPRRSALGSAPEDEAAFPLLTWLKRTLMDSVYTLVLNSAAMQKPSPAGQQRGLRPDGSNLPWVIEDMKQKAPGRFKEWVLHLRTVLPDLDTIRVVEREEDRSRYVVVRYRGGLEAPSWVVSDGTLRLLALTLLAYLPLRGVYLIEEPENGLHPSAIQAVFQSLSSVYDAQVLLATNSPVILALAAPRQLLCFAKTSESATDIVRGSEHPALKDWKGEPDLSILYAAGVLG